MTNIRVTGIPISIEDTKETINTENNQINKKVNKDVIELGNKEPLISETKRSINKAIVKIVKAQKTL